MEKERASFVMHVDGQMLVDFGPFGVSQLYLIKKREYINTYVRTRMPEL